MIIVSSCLAGINCRYDGCSKTNDNIVALIKKGEAIPLCPEQLGGLPTPRTPAEIQKNQVINKSGDNVTEFYKRGAKEALSLAKLVNAKRALLKSKSPMCGAGKIYDGNFTGTLIKGDGFFTKVLKENNIQVESI